MRKGLPVFIYCTAAALALPGGQALAQASSGDAALSSQWIPAGFVSSSASEDTSYGVPSNLGSSHPGPSTGPSPNLTTASLVTGTGSIPQVTPDNKSSITMPRPGFFSRPLPPSRPSQPSSAPLSAPPLPAAAAPPAPETVKPARPELQQASLPTGGAALLQDGQLPVNRRTSPSDLTQVAAVTPAPALAFPDTQLRPTYKHSQSLRTSQVPKIMPAADNNAPVDLQADNLVRDEGGKTVTATGHVEMTQSGRTVRADQVVYDMAHDTVTASGHVIFIDRDGTVNFADNTILSNQMKDGFVSGLHSYMAKGGRFTAEQGDRKDATTSTMHNATYTTCECEEDKKGNPPWLIRARTVRYDEPQHRIVYKNATVNVLGVPVLWTPYFASSDGQVKRKSGFLTPTFGYNTRLGLNTTERYYWSMNPQQDATFGTTLMAKKSPLFLGQYRQRFDNAELKFDGNFSDSSYVDKSGTDTVHESTQMRGYLAGDGLWDMSDTWRSGFKIRAVSDDAYLRQFRLNGADVLQNEIFAERFSGRNYARVDAQAFQDIRTDRNKTEQPSVLPEMIANFTGEPNGTLGGRWDASVSALGLTRDGNGQDLGRLSARTGWQRRLVLPVGLVTTADAHVRGDAYRVDDRDVATGDPTRDKLGYATRLFPNGHIVTAYPLVKAMERAQLIVSPEAAISFSPNLDVHRSDIPNEDSQDVQLDATNLFNENRFPGYDRIEDGTHADYGIRTGLYGYQGSSGEIFLGQSYRISHGDPFPEGSGLSSRSSDYVGQVNGVYNKDFGFDYRFDLASDSLASERHEFDGYANWNRLLLSARYLYAKALEHTDIVEDRQQMDGDATIKLTQEWNLRTGAVYDLGHDEGLRRLIVGIDYLGCCMMLSLNAAHNWTDHATASGGTDVTFRIGLKGLGDFPQRPQPVSTDKVDVNSEL